MLELLNEPAFIALAGTLVGGTGFKFGEKMFAKPKKSVEDKMIDKLAIPRGWVKGEQITLTDAFDCQVWETRHIEANPYWKDGQPYGDPLPVADMSVCENLKCANCHPTRLAKNPNFGKPIPPRGGGGSALAKPAPGSRPRSDHNLKIKGSPFKSVYPDYEKYLEAKYNDPRYKGYRYEDWKFQQQLRDAQRKSDELRDRMNAQIKKQHEWDRKMEAEKERIRKMSEHVRY